MLQMQTLPHAHTYMDADCTFTVAPAASPPTLAMMDGFASLALTELAHTALVKDMTRMMPNQMSQMDLTTHNVMDPS